MMKQNPLEMNCLFAGVDETVSMVSDTWSTDVLASDSETIEQPLPPPEPPVQILPGPQVITSYTLFVGVHHKSSSSVSN